jgi:hypothetical protein
MPPRGVQSQNRILNRAVALYSDPHLHPLPHRERRQTRWLLTNFLTGTTSCILSHHWVQGSPLPREA